MSIFGMIAFGWFGIAVVGFIFFGWAERRWSNRGSGKQSRIARLLKRDKQHKAAPEPDALPDGAEIVEDMPHGKTVMRPARRLRLISVVPGAVVMLFLWGPYGPLQSLGLTFTLLLSALVFYAGIYIAAYEASYDAEGITAPDWFFRQRIYPWSSFEGVQTGKSFLVKMRFDGHGKLMLQKYLVGMPSLLAFLSNVETAHQQA